MTTFTSAATTHINQMPLSALLLPSPRLPMSALLCCVYARASPVFTGRVPNDQLLPEKAQLEVWTRAMMTELKERKFDLPQQDSGKRIGFFPQGILIGALHVVCLSASLCCVAAILWTRLR